MSKKFNASQQKAIDHENGDLLISAGAGAGKTATLTARIIEKILAGSNIDKMLVVTFTKESANDLKNKIQEGIVEKMKEESGKNREKLHSQIVKIGSADISTIHSFCLKIIRPNFASLPIDSNFRIGDENEIDYIKNEVMKDVIEDFYESQTPSEEFLIVSDCFSSISDSTALSKKLLTLYDKLSSTKLFLDTLLISKSLDGDFMDSGFGKMLIYDIDLFVKHYKNAFSSVVAEALSINATGEFLTSLQNDLDFLDRVSNAISKNLDYATFKNIFASYSADKMNGLTKSGLSDHEVISTIRDNFKKKIIKYNEYFSSSADSLLHAYNQNAIVCQAMYDILSKFNNEFIERKRKYGVCDYNDLERYTYKLLYKPNGEPSDLAKEVAKEYDEIFIDEYQDTNSLQDAIFAAISKNNRFMVGDIKQSIYRFRSAEPEIFSHYRTVFEDITNKKDEGKNGKTIFMSLNYRCDENVIDLSNDVSDYMFLNSDGIPYQKEDNLGFKKKIEGKHTPQKCELCIIDRSAFPDEDDHELIQAKYVAKRIYEMIDKKHLPNGEKIKAKDIAILLRKGKHKSYYIDELKKLGIDAEYVDNVKFFEKPAVLLLLSLLNTIDNPYNDTYLAGALCSPLFKFSFDELLHIRKGQKDVPLYSALSSYEGIEAISNKIAKFNKKLSIMQEEVKKMNAYEAVSYVMNTCGLLSSSKKSERIDLIKFYDHARSYEKNSYKGLCKFLLYIESIKDSKSKDGAFASNDKCVKIMSVHASKGLEFEICFLSNLETGFSDQDTREPILFERHLGISSYIGNRNSLVKYDTLLRKVTSLAIKKATKEEEMRVLYVALTRARSKIIATASMKNANKELALIKSFSKYLSKYHVYSHNSHLDYILNTYFLKKPDIDFELVNSVDQINVNPEKGDEKTTDFNKLKKLEEILNTRLDFTYEYGYLNKLPSKVSVSRLKPDILDSDENEEIDLSKDLRLKPRFLSEVPKDESTDAEQVTATGAEKGTATHLFMQFCDFENLEANGYDNELERLIKNSFISKDDSKNIEQSHIESFINSSLFKRMKNAKVLKRELRFNVMLSAKDFTADPELQKEKILVQGVVDAIFEDEDGKLILVDYKTDKVTNKNYENILKDRYTSQLLYYKKAIELIYEKPLDKVLLYSVPLAKTVEL